jgi:hypothetical protein
MKQPHPLVVGDLYAQHTALVAYLLSKVSAEDWHAVADAACDLREIDAKLSVIHAPDRLGGGK